MDNEQRITTEIKVPNKNQEILRKHFGQCFDKNGNFDVEKFKKELSENEIDFYKESYGLDWLGKSYARILASDEATTLLREDENHNQKEENKNSQNLLIKGDNLEVLKHLSNAYFEKVKMVYIDPPYNTGDDGFLYQDDRKFSIDELKQLAGIDEEKAKRILDFTQSKSNSHSAWLTFMYPRLYVAKQLLSDDGAIFISIDDNEVAQLKILLDEIFGEENFVGELTWEKKKKGTFLSNSLTNIKESIFVYSKNSAHFNGLIGEINTNKETYPCINASNKREIRKIKKGIKSRYKESDYFLKKGSEISDTTMSLILHSDLKIKNYELAEDLLIEGNWRYTQENMDAFAEDHNLYITQDLYLRRIVVEPRYKTIKDLLLREGTDKSLKYDYFNPKNLFEDGWGSNEDSEEELRLLMGTIGLFNNPKPTKLLKKLIASIRDNDMIVMDFFAGSGTTGESVIQLNLVDGGKRKYILVQLPEGIDSKKDKAAFNFVTKDLHAEATIFEITKERLKRASNKIKDETIPNKIAEKENEINALNGSLDLEDKEEKINQLLADIENLKKQDLGFKVFETIPIWDDYRFEADELNPQAKLFNECELTDEDLKALLITWKTYDGIALTENLKEIDLGGYAGYFASEKLYLLHKGFTTDNLQHILKKIDTDKNFNPTSIIAFGYHFESKNLREI
jgi:adenine-specific DNA-methyltransferase